MVDAVIDVLDGIDRALVDDGSRAAFQKFVKARLAGRRRALGWWPPDGKQESDDDRALERRSVLSAMGELAEDATTLAEAEKYAAAWVAQPSASVASEIRQRSPSRSRRCAPGPSASKELRAALVERAHPGGPRHRHPRDVGSFGDAAVLQRRPSTWPWATS